MKKNVELRQKVEGLTFRDMQLSDLPSVLQIERKAFPSPWSPAAFVAELKDNIYALYTVATLNDKIVAYGGMWLILDEAHVTNIAVHPDYQGKGIGDALLAEMEQRARSRGSRSMTLEVRVGNKVAQNLYRKHGFYCAGVRPEYYSDNQEDAYIMWKTLTDEDDSGTSL